MNIMRFKLPCIIKDYNMPQLHNILSERGDDITIAYQTSSSIILSNNDKISCIRTYYANADGATINCKTKDINACSRIKRFFNVSGAPFDCKTCHLNMLTLLNNNEVCLREQKNKK